MKRFAQLLLTLGVLLLAFAAQAQVITFGDVDPGSAINTTYQSSFGITFAPTSPNSTAGQVFADNPGLPPNPTRDNNTLVGIFNPIFVNFDAAVYPVSAKLTFDVVPDPNGFGTNNAPVLAYDSIGNLIGSFSIDETVPGTYTAYLPGLQKLLLPADVYYDNLRPESVPEPGVVSFISVGLLLFSAACFRTICGVKR